MPEPITPELIQEAARGSQQAFRAIVEANQRFVYAVAFRFVHDQHEAEDITQDVFVRLWKNLHAYNAEVKLTTWLYKIVTNRCLDFLKSRHGRYRNNKVDLSLQLNVNSTSTPEINLHRQELTALVYAAADELTPKQKAVFILRDLEGLTSDEVCETLSMTAGNVKSNLFHARQKIAEKLKNKYQTTDKSFL